MVKSGIIATIVASILGIGLVSSIVFADSIVPPSSYTQLSEDGKYIFVMLSYDTESLLSPCSGEPYKTSGLYAADICTSDGEDVLLWSIGDWYAHGVYLSSDGSHLVRMGPWAGLKNSGRRDVQELAVAFYEDGQLLEKYSIADLVRVTGTLPRSVSHFMWRENVSFDDVASQLTIITLNEERYVFDAKSGEIIDKELPVMPIRLIYDGLISFEVIGVLILVFGLIVFLAVVIIRRIKRKNKIHNS